MKKLSKDTLLRCLQMAGMESEDAEKVLTDSVMEMINGPASKYQVPARRVKRSSKPNYNEENYPHFLPSEDIKKYTIRVTLKGITPAIYRKFECPSNISLRHLADLVMHLMGWYNMHLNHIIGPYETYYVPYYQHDPQNDWCESLFQEDYALSDILNVKGKSIKWEYDFGDSWLHEIRLSSVAEYKEGEPHYIVFKSGKGDCPPEDCGGIWGYKDLLDILEKLKSNQDLTSEEKEQLDWAGWDKDYDPEDPDEEYCMAICASFSY